MEYISSDTNVWFDFYAISKTHLPFRLDCRYIMFHETLRAEIIDPPELINELCEFGLEAVDLSTEEFYLAAELRRKHLRISDYDAIALSVAKARKIVLLTDDNALQNAAEKECVIFMGSIGLIDRLLHENKITTKEYLDCLNKLEESAFKWQATFNRRDR